MFTPKESILMAEVAELAKGSNQEAIDYLRQRFSLRVFTFEEIRRVNHLRFEQGMTINQAIEQVNTEREV